MARSSASWKPSVDASSNQKPEHRRARRYFQPEAALQEGLCGHLAGRIFGAVVRRQMPIGRRIPLGVVDAVQDPGKRRAPSSKEPLESAAVAVPLDLARVG